MKQIVSKDIFGKLFTFVRIYLYPPAIFTL